MQLKAMLGGSRSWRFEKFVWPSVTGIHKPSITTLGEALKYVGGCQSYGPFWGTLNIRCRIIIGIQKVTIIFTIAHVCAGFHLGRPLIQA